MQNTFDRQFTSESKDELKELLQILAIFPSIEISFEILQKSIGFEKLRVNLQKLVERGWLTNKEDSYKLHQIIRTFIITEYKIEYEKVTFIFENIAKYICDIIPTCYRVEVQESEGNLAIYEQEDI